MRQTCLGVAACGVPTWVDKTIAGRTGVWKPLDRAVAGTALIGEGEPARRFVTGDIGRRTERALREWRRPAAHLGSSMGRAKLP